MRDIFTGDSFGSASDMSRKAAGLIDKRLVYSIYTGHGLAGFFIWRNPD